MQHFQKIFLRLFGRNLFIYHRQRQQQAISTAL